MESVKELACHRISWFKKMHITRESGRLAGPTEKEGFSMPTEEPISKVNFVMVMLIVLMDYLCIPKEQRTVVLLRIRWLMA